MLLVKRRLHGMPVPVLGETLDRRDLTPIGLNREHRARLDRLTVHQHGARPAVRRVAPDHRPRQVQLLAQEMHQEHPRLDLTLVLAAVYLDPYFSQPALLSLRTSDLAPVRFTRSAHSTGFSPSAVNEFTPAAFSPYIRRFCSLHPFLPKGAGSLARRHFSCTLTVDSPLYPVAGNCNIVVT